MRPCPQCKNPCDEAHKFCPVCGFPVSKVAVNPDDPLIGRNLPGGYIILDLVGIGGMGRVYRAEQTNLGRTVAIKVIHPHLAGDESTAARFITEARAASRLNHPNSVSVIDFGKTDDGQLYLVMEFLRGADLARVAYEEGPLAFRRIVNVLTQVLGALSEAHALEIIHRDLKPENIILEPTRSGGDFVKVVDFGLAKMRETTHQPNVTSPGIVCGTPEYMSPEQGRGDPLDARSDLYGVAVIFYQLLTGRLPFEAETATQVVIMHITVPPKDPRTVAPDRKIPEPLARVCLRGLGKAPVDRFADADAFIDALTTAMAEVEAERTSIRKLPVREVECATCGARNGATQKFCGECGGSLAHAPVLSPAIGTARTSFPPASFGVDEGRTLPGIAGDRPKPTEREATKLPLPLLGREDELRWLADRREDTTTAFGCARVVGEAGTGKTRLVREFLAVCADDGDVVVEAGPDGAWAEIGYSTVRVAIMALAGLPHDGGAAWGWTGAGAEARRGLMEIFDVKPAGSDVLGLSPGDRRYAAAEALRWALTRASERGRLVVAVDDLHHVDGPSRNAFVDVVAEPPKAAGLLVVAYAPGFDPGLPATAAARVLAGLPVPLVARLSQQTGARIPSMVGATTISALHLEQLIRFSREQGAGAPSRLADIIALRVERLDTDARRALQALAVVGDGSEVKAVVALLGKDADLPAAITVLTKAGMVESTAGRISITHPLLREVVLAAMPAAVRRELHEAAGQWAEANNAPPEVRALHAYYAQDAFQALVLLERVSLLAASRGDAAGSIIALRRGLELSRREIFRGELDDPVRAVVIFSRKLGEALARLGQFTDAEGVLREALDLTGPSGPDRAKVLGALAQVAHARERRQEAHGYLSEARAIARKSGAPELIESLDELERAMAPAR